jgi:hypothetical protein
MRRLVVLLTLFVACTRSRPPAPRAEFLVSGGDSTFWVASGDTGIHVRGSPLLLARYEGHFYEVFVADDDFSFDDALLIGQRVYRRDLLSGDSALVFIDTVVPRFASAYARAHPDERPLDPDEDGRSDPATVATAEVGILDLLGPYLSYEYHQDLELPGRRPWHTTRHGVIDLRSGREAQVADLFGDSTARQLTAVGRAAYQSTRDSILRGAEGRDPRALAALGRFEFDASSFSLTAVDGRPAVAFAIPGSGEGPAGNLLELDPLGTEPTSWWKDLNGSLPTDDAGNDRWLRPGYRVLARYDTSGDVARVVLGDSTRREWSLGTMTGPLRRIDWLDRPSLGAAERRALSRAFDQAASYDERSRVAVVRRRGSTMRLASLVRRAPSAERRAPR